MKRRIGIAVVAMTTLLGVTLVAQPAQAAPGICSSYGYTNLFVNADASLTVVIGAPTLGLPINNSVFVQDNVFNGFAFTAWVTQAPSGAWTGVYNARPSGVTAKGWSGFAVEC